jgi:Zn-dependent hydrolases, including glyoxylases
MPETQNNRNNTKPKVYSFYEQGSSTFSYIVSDPNSQSCAIIDSVLDFDYPSGSILYGSADQIIQCVKDNDLVVELLIETHVHADHLSAAPYIQSILGGKIAISKHINVVQKEFGRLFNEGTEFQRDGSQFDVLFEDDQSYKIGTMECLALHTPGHTPACTTHVMGSIAFVGDTLFMPDGGTARADFPGGDARTLYHSISLILSLPDDTELYMCHDYQPNGRELQCVTTVKEQKTKNIHVMQGVSEDEFVSMREERDKSLGMPTLILPSLQTNMRAGYFPEPENNETVYLKVPLTGIKESLVAKQDKSGDSDK